MHRDQFGEFVCGMQPGQAMGRLDIGSSAPLPPFLLGLRPTANIEFHKCQI